MAGESVIARFLDAAEEPTKTLGPIRGYERETLVSLEKAIDGIKGLVPDLDTIPGRNVPTGSYRISEIPIGSRRKLSESLVQESDGKSSGFGKCRNDRVYRCPDTFQRPTTSHRNPVPEIPTTSDESLWALMKSDNFPAGSDCWINRPGMVWTAKRNSQKPQDGLSSEMSAAIHLYTMQWEPSHKSLYTQLNTTLRSEKRDTLKPWFSYLKLFLTALHKLPPVKKTIWRGIRGNLLDEYGEDKIWWGVSSCTETVDVMERFLGTSGERTIFAIECTNGKVISGHSHFGYEKEIILMPGTYLRVLSKWSPALGLHMIQLRETEAPVELIASPFAGRVLWLLLAFAFDQYHDISQITCNKYCRF